MKRFRQGGSIRDTFRLLGPCLILAACERSSPPQDVTSLDQLPAHGQYIAEYTGQEMKVVGVSNGRKFQWDLPTSAIQGPGAVSRSHRVTWSPGIRKFVFANSLSASLISTDGLATLLNLQMPGKLQPLEGMETYSISPDGRFLAYYLLTRDAGEPQPDGFGRLYEDLMIQDTVRQRQFSGVLVRARSLGVQTTSALRWGVGRS